MFSLFRPLIWFRTTFLLLLTCKFHLIIVGPSHKTIKYRKLQSINMEAFKADIQNSDLIKYPKTNATELAQQYDSALYTLINLHAPLVSKKISLKPPNPWMTPAILASKRYLRHLERVWRRNPTALNRSRLSRHISAIDRCQRQNRLTIPKLLLSILAIMGHYGRHSTKSYTIALKCTFLITLLLPLWQTHSARFPLTKALSFTLLSLLTHTHVCWTLLIPGRFLRNLSYVTADEVRHLVLRAPCKSSGLDPIPTSLVKDCIDILITPITSIINLSLTESSFPSHFKSAHVSHLLKNLPSIRIAWRITGQCLILASCPRFLRK